MKFAKMLGMTNHPPCGQNCCGTPSAGRRRERRRLKRRERQTWRRELFSVRY